MLQRVQTIYLLLAILTIAGFCFAPGIQYQSLEGSLKNVAIWDVKYFFKGYLFFINPILLGIAAGLALISIFLYKKRSLQMTLTLLSIVPILASVAYTLYFFQTKETALDILYTAWNALAILPVIFLVLAYRGIKKDEELIKGLDRLR